MALLVQRAEKVRRAIDASNHRYLRILPAIITSKPRSEVAADIEQAEKLGVFVITRETLEQAFNRTLVMTNADQIFEESEQAVRAAQAKYESEPSLPFDGS